MRILRDRPIVLRLLAFCVLTLAVAVGIGTLLTEGQTRAHLPECRSSLRTSDAAFGTGMRSESDAPGEAARSEVAPRPIELGAPLDRSDMEISGLAWYGDTLVVLPEVPPNAEEDDARLLYGLSRASLEEAMEKNSAAAIRPIPIPLRGVSEIGVAHTDAGNRMGVSKGFEAIAFDGNRAYFAVEVEREDASMAGVLMWGTVAPGLTEVRLDRSTRRRLPMQAALPNMSYEALAVRADTVLAFFEANGARVNGSPVAQRYDASLDPLGAVPFPTLEYRLTDATALDDDGRFWVVNYLYPEERHLLNPGTDSLTLRFAPGRTHRSARGVERLVEYHYTPSGIHRTNSPPLQFELREDQWRNWEGVVRFASGFLVVTDRYPSTILAYVPAASCLGTEAGFGTETG